MIRECYVCGKEMVEGYVLNAGQEYYCDQECVKKEFDNVYGEKGWKWEEEENTAGGYITTDEYGDIDIFWSEWDADDPDSW